MNYPHPIGRMGTCLGLLLVSTLALPAQQAPATPPVASNDEIITLSPFVVSSTQDNGYAATETLAGTRLRTNLRDVASSMSVLTAEMVQDLGVNSIDAAANFLPSSDQIHTSGGNISGQGNAFDGYPLRFGAGQTFSIRGVQVSGVSSDFFNTLAPSDFFNAESTTVSRGPNSILFGTGGPAGVALNTSKRAQVNRQKTQVNLQTDRWGSARGSLDHNQVLIKGKLALRINTLSEDRREFRNNEGQFQDRLALALTLKPTADTTVSVLHENYDYARNSVPLSPWFSRGLLRWDAAGRPTVDFVANNRAWNAAGRTFLDAAGNPVPVFPGVVDADGLIDAQADFDPKGLFTQDTNPSNIYLSGLGLTNPVWNLRYQPVVRDDIFDGITGLSSAPNPLGLVDYFGIPIDANLTVGSRDRPGYESWGRWTQVFVEQKLARKLYLEVAANVAERSVEVSPVQDSYVRVDVAKYLPDSSLNPGYLKPYTEIQPQLNRSRDKAQDIRATLSYELDATRWNRWLGRHSFAGLFQNSKTDTKSDRLKVFNKGSVGQTAGGWSADPEAGQHVVAIRRYVINGVVDDLMDPKTLIDNLATVALQGTVPGPIGAIQPALNPDLRLFAAGQRTQQDNQSKSFAWQSYWFKERLVTTFGVRKDEISTRSVQGGRTDYDPAIPVPTPIPAGQSLSNYSYFTPSSQLTLPTTSLDTSGITRTYAAVLHATDWLSLTYNKSANFSPTGASTTDMMGEPKKNAEGTTNDVGLRFFLLNNRVIISTNYFVNEVLNNNAGVSAFNAGYGSIISLLRANYKNKGDSHFLAMPDAYPSESPNVGSYSNVTTKGYEATITFNPNNNWRIMLTGSANSIKSTGLYPDAYTFLFTENKFSDYTGIPTWKNMVTELQAVANGQVSSLFDLDPTNPTHRQQATADANLINGFITAAQNKWNDAKATEGAVLAPNGKYAANALINYTFTEGRLNGFGLGFNARWRSGGVAGYYRLPNPTTGTPEGSIDVTRPIMGDAFLEFGALASYRWKVSPRMSARVQLNVENLLGADKLLLRAVGTDSLGVFGTQYDYVPLRWEMRRPRNFKLSVTLDF